MASVRMPFSSLQHVQAWLRHVGPAGLRSCGIGLHPLALLASCQAPTMVALQLLFNLLMTLQSAELFT
jgi:hypothetical protein